MQYFSADNRHSNPSALDTSISNINPYFLSTLLFWGTRYFPIFYKSKTQNDSVLQSGTYFFNSVLFCIYLFLYYFIVFVFVCCPCFFYLSFLGSTFAGPAFCVTLVFWLKLIIIINNNNNKNTDREYFLETFFSISRHTFFNISRHLVVCRAAQENGACANGSEYINRIKNVAIFMYS